MGFLILILFNFFVQFSLLVVIEDIYFLVIRHHNSVLYFAINLLVIWLDGGFISEVSLTEWYLLSYLQIVGVEDEQVRVAKADQRVFVDGLNGWEGLAWVDDFVVYFLESLFGVEIDSSEGHHLVCETGGDEVGFIDDRKPCLAAV